MEKCIELAFLEKIWFPTQISDNGNLLTKPADIAECLNNFFVDKIKNIRNNLSPPNIDPLRILKAKNFPKGAFSFQAVHPDKVEEIIRGLKSSNVTGVDFLNSNVLKLVGSEIVPALTHIINLSIKQGKFPNYWKHAHIVPLHKKEDILAAKNYRPVAILPTVSKVLERVMFNQIVEFFDANGLFHPNHHGFRKQHSTSTALLQMYDGWVEAADKGQITGVCMLDLSAAFDVVDHDLLLEKLQLYGFGSDALAWVTSATVSRTT